MKDFIPRSPGELENQGWLQMKAMLDEHMPVKSIESKKIVGSVRWWNRLPLRQVAVLIPFICISILTGRQGIFDMNPIVQERIKSIDENSLVTDPELLNPVSNNNNRSLNNEVLFSIEEKPGQVAGNLYSSTIQTKIIPDVEGKSSLVSIDRLKGSTYVSSVSVPLSQAHDKHPTIFSKKVKAPEHKLPLLVIRQKPNKEVHTKFDIRAGLGSNSSNTGGIYPVVMTSYHLNERSAISVGVEANVPFTPKDVDKRNVSFINDTSMNVQFEVNREKIDKLVYFNVPLEYSFKVKKNLALISGMELSFLQNVHTSNQNEVYDYSSSPASVLGPAISTYVNGLQRLEDKVEVKHTNMKFNAGVAYSLGPASLEARYHYNLKEPVLFRDFNGNMKGGNKGMFSIRLLYQIK